MDQTTRNTLRNAVTQCRRLLEESTAQALQGRFGIFAVGKKGDVQVEDGARMGHLSEEDRACRRDLLDHIEHIRSLGYQHRDALDQLTREIAFTHLNRLCAYKMMEARGLIREAVSRGVKSQGFFFYLADHPDAERLHASGQQEAAYRHFLDWLGGTLSQEIGVLFNPNDPANRIYPPQRVLDDVLALINDEALQGIWAQDETIGWVYQYFTPKELRDQARKESQAPRNSYELAFRNQFFTPRYVVEFLTDNTLGRVWYEMRQGQTSLAQRCRYLMRRPDEVFLGHMTAPHAECAEANAGTEKAAALLARDADAGEFPEFVYGREEDAQRLIEFAHMVDGYQRHGLNSDDPNGAQAVLTAGDEAWSGDRPDFATVKTQDLMDFLFFAVRCDRQGGGIGHDPNGRACSTFVHNRAAVAAANEVRRRVLASRREDLSQEELLRQPVSIPFRPAKDPRTILMLDPACGSMHFGLYAFDLFEVIYAEAWDIEEAAGPDALTRPEGLKTLHETYATRDAFLRDVPRLIIERNIHGIDIDPRAVQIAGLSLWLRAQRSWQQLGVRPDERPRIARSNVVCAEPMPGDAAMLKEFTAGLQPKVLGQLVEEVFDKMKLAGEAGSLLKIEEDIRAAAAKARHEYLRWKKQQDASAGFLFQQYAPKAEPDLLDFADLGDERFLDRAEEEIVEALRRYADQAGGGHSYRRRLFAQDAGRGFAFVDVCRKRYDAVLMNPPFGKATRGGEKRLRSSYPESWKELYACFAERAHGVLGRQGVLGAITSSLFLYSKRLRAYRRTLIECPLLDTLVDLGSGVLDSATVDTALTIQRRRKDPTALFLDLTQADDKGQRLISAVAPGSSGFTVRDLTVFLLLPNWPLCHYVHPRMMALWKSGQRLEPAVATVVAGNLTFDDERFVRLRIEVGPAAMADKWVPYEKGGSFQPFLSPTDVVVDWEHDGREMRENQMGRYGTDAQVMQSVSWWHREGLTYPRISSVGFSPKVLPAGHMFSEKGMCVFPVEKAHALAILALLASTWTEEMLLAFGRHRAYENSAVASLPIGPDTISRSCTVLQSLAKQGVGLMLRAEAAMETSALFCSPPCVKYSEGRPNLTGASAEHVAGLTAPLAKVLAQIDAKAAECFFGEEVPPSCTSEGRDTLIQRVEVLQRTMARDDGVDALQYCLGCLVGRWDTRFVTSGGQSSELPDAFAPLPACPPGMLQGPDGLPAKPEDVPADYPIRIDWDGILADDPEHSDDIVRRVREVLAVIWRDRAEAIEREACEILGVRELRDYFRKPGNGGFWMDHVKRYSKSRRKAPIYWYLRSAKGNYGVWLYYHRLSKDTYFKALVSYVEPKIRLEEDRLATLRSRKAAAGTAGREAKQLERDVDRQEQFVSELLDFRDKLRRVADLHLAPDLNDGVILNIAPLHELVPWKEAKACWDALRDANYDWAHIAYQLWPERVKELCRRDRSVAIAHGLEDICEVVPPQRRETPASEEEAHEEGDSDNDTE